MSLEYGDNNNLRWELEVRMKGGDIKRTLALNEHLAEVGSDYYQFTLLLTQSCLFLAHQAPDRLSQGLSGFRQIPLPALRNRLCL